VKLRHGAAWVIAVFVLVEIASTTLGSYGYFIDELYYLACARHLAWGYVDHPPLSIGVIALASAILGSSKLAIRLPAIAAAAGSVAVSAVLAKRFGGGRFAQMLAAICAASSPIALILGSFHSMNAIELLLWPLVILALVHAADGEPPGCQRTGWLVAGAFFGLGLENKHTMVTLGFALAVGIAVTPMRAQLRSRWPWLGVAIAALLIVPNLLWQRAHGFESLEFYRNAQAMKNIPTPVLKGIFNQVLVAGPGAIVVWIAGAVWLVRAEAARRFRFIGIAFSFSSR
jgi:4-amino-4-deoxy-L-arabinose transferase-like glycosyltransferase